MCQYVFVCVFAFFYVDMHTFKVTCICVRTYIPSENKEGVASCTTKVELRGKSVGYEKIVRRATGDKGQGQ